MKVKKSKKERKRDREILSKYHQKVTEEALQPLYEQFVQWKEGSLPYEELTEHIHDFHKQNQKIWKTFNYDNEEFLVFRAKKEMGLFNDQDRQNELYQRLWYLEEEE